MTDWINDVQEKHRRSSLPVSAFFLVTSLEGIQLMFERLRALCVFGVTNPQIERIAETVTDAFASCSSSKEYYRRCELTFQVDEKVLTGEFCYIRNFPERGFEVEIVLPGIIASSAVGFIDNQTGFWTAYMPPTFYS